jgi:hypothetical protein
MRASHSKLILWFTSDKDTLEVVVPSIVALLAQLENPQLVVSTELILKKMAPHLRVSPGIMASGWPTQNAGSGSPRQGQHRRQGGARRGQQCNEEATDLLREMEQKIQELKTKIQ